MAKKTDTLQAVTQTTLYL